MIIYGETNIIGDSSQSQIKMKIYGETNIIGDNSQSQTCASHTCIATSS